jgi:two-component SAPR family response regulator
LSYAPVWICGPPGSGKTTLAASYVDARVLPAVWYQIDGGDRDPASFFYYLSLSAAQSGLCEQRQLPLLTGEYSRDIPGFARRYFRLFYEALPRPCALIFDNYQEASDDAGPLHGIIGDALNEAPEGMTVLVLSRTQPPPRYATLRARRRLEILAWDELRLDLDEATQIATALRGKEMTGVDRLLQRCDGWAAGLTLLLTQRESGNWIADEQPSTQVLFDYFATEFFDRMPAAAQLLLMQTSLMPWFDLDMAHAVSGHKRISMVLDGLRRRYLFVQVHSGSRPTYSYHALLREFLMSRLRARSGKNELARLMRKSALALARAGAPGDAVPLYLSVGARAQAIKLILAEAPTMAAHGRYRQLQAWIKALSPPVVRSDGWLNYWLGLCEAASDGTAARSSLERAFRRFQATGDVAGQIAAAGAVVDSIHFEFRDCKPLDGWINILDRVLGGATRVHDPSVEISAYTSLLTAALNLPPEPRSLDRWITRTQALLNRVSDPNVRVRAATALLTLFALTGRAREAIDLTGRISADLSDPRLSPMVKCQWLLPSANVKQVYYADAQASRAESEAALEVARSNGFTALLPVIHWVDGLNCLAAGDADGAKRNLVHIKPFVDRSGPLNGIFDALTAGIALIENQPAKALRHAQLADDAAVNWMMQITSTVYLAYAHCANGDYDQTLAVAQRSRAIFNLLGGRGGQNDPALPQAYALLMRKDYDAAAQLLRERFAVLARERIMTTVIWLPRIMSPLCAFALERGIEVGFVKEVIQHHGLAAPSQVSEEWPWSVQVRTLGRFEVAVRGQPLLKSRKSPRKVLALFKTLIALGGADISEQSVADSLWSEKEGDAARNALAITLHRLRKLLGEPSVIEVRSGRISIDAQRVWIDAWAFKKLPERVNHLPLSGVAQNVSEAVRLYHGAFLKDEDDILGASRPREALRLKFVRLLVPEARRLEHAGAFAQAAFLYAHGIGAEPLNETFYQGLMRCHGAEKRVTEVVGAYQQLRKRLSASARISPSPASEALYLSLLDNRPTAVRGGDEGPQPDHLG